MDASWKHLSQALLATVVLAVVSGCESNGGVPLDRDTTAAAPRPARTGFPKITLDVTEGMRLGEAVRRLGETSGGGAVLVAGMEILPAAPVHLTNSDYAEGLKRIVGARECEFQVRPHYVFVYPSGYGQLADVSLEGVLHPRFEALRATYAVGAGTDLYNALALLGDALQVTLVADNVVADAWCGELFLEDAPLSSILEAVLKSALVPADAVRVESTAEYVFIRSAANENRAPALLNPEEVDRGMQRRLENSVDVRLPGPARGVAFGEGASPLAEVLPALSAQLGVDVTTDPSMADFPVNVAVLHEIPAKTALDLIVWQWPLPRYGYRVTAGGVHFCPREG